PNIGALVDWLGRAHGPNHRHYILLPTAEAARFALTGALHAIPYGPTPEFLPPFLSDLRRPGSVGRSVSRDSASVLEAFDEFADQTDVTVPRMVVIPPGSFEMGTHPDSTEILAEELPQHKVNIDYSFAVSKFPVTFAEWDAFEASTGARLRPKDCGWGRGA